ncbi:imidazole glycerol phosphate synthase subunit HisH [Paraflavitalea speifideaquila]|uniref:imidazole glycerol phosphate synthase subunit HisH n=1 Tax=Paraflavitalea speifideaquila TaxID=3076558 RepID=UPI0028E6CB5E|nr:imidazole glycerol phosphate synthase subunit HisH [Paraflavitalea speifideiaquila]
MTIVIVDYGVGNLTSIQNMLKKGGKSAIISGDADVIATASKLLLPGMGHFDNCMQKFNASGLRSLVEEKVFIDKIPVLGICVGLQMFMRSSEEGSEVGLGWIPGKTIRFNPELMKKIHKIPNMGWLDIKWRKSSPLMEGLQDARFYFAHSFHIQLERIEDSLVEAEYGYSFTAGVEYNNILGVQFHPEKSHRFGMQLLKNFAENY